MRSIPIRDLFEIHAEGLELTWLVGQEGGDRAITMEDTRQPGHRVVGDEFSTPRRDTAPHLFHPARSLVGHLNLIHLNQIQICSYSELRYLHTLRDISRQDAFRQLFAHEPCALLISDGQEAPEDLIALCQDTHTPLFLSPQPSGKLTEALHYYLSNLLAEVVTLHGVFMEVCTIGVLLTGPSGSGKSELAIELITRGHRLVADDAPEFSKLAPDILNGTCPEMLQDFLEVRGLGLINVRQLFGDAAIKRNKYLRLIICLERGEAPKIDRLAGTHRTRRILDIDVPELTLPVAPGRNLAVLVECAARNHILRMGGYDAAKEFIDRQHRMIQRG